MSHHLIHLYLIIQIQMANSTNCEAHQYINVFVLLLLPLSCVQTFSSALHSNPERTICRITMHMNFTVIRNKQCTSTLKDGTCYMLHFYSTYIQTPCFHKQREYEGDRGKLVNAYAEMCSLE